MLRLVITISRSDSKYIQGVDLLEEDTISSVAFHVSFDLVLHFFSC